MNGQSATGFLFEFENVSTVAFPDEDCGLNDALIPAGRFVGTANLILSVLPGTVDADVVLQRSRLLALRGHRAAAARLEPERVVLRREPRDDERPARACPARSVAGSSSRTPGSFVAPRAVGEDDEVSMISVVVFGLPFVICTEFVNTAFTDAGKPVVEKRIVPLYPPVGVTLTCHVSAQPG